MRECGSYEAIAHVYDLLNAEIDYPAWADFVEQCFDRYLSTRPDLVLDLACGTGSMTVALADKGYDMIGVDNSADMLSEAYFRKGERNNILLLQQDMRTFELYGTVGAVTCCLDSLNYLLTEKDLCDCFSCVHTYLDANGLFLFDLNTPYKFRTVYGDNAYILEDEIAYETENSSDKTEPVPFLCAWQNNFCPETGICDFDLSLFEQQKNGSYLRSDEHQQERCYTWEEISSALEKCGFAVLGRYSDIRFSPVTDTTERWYICARAIKPLRKSTQP